MLYRRNQNRLPPAVARRLSRRRRTGHARQIALHGDRFPEPQLQRFHEVESAFPRYQHLLDIAFLAARQLDRHGPDLGTKPASARHPDFGQCEESDLPRVRGQEPGLIYLRLRR